jgi:hypothetical protein
MFNFRRELQVPMDVNMMWWSIGVVNLPMCIVVVGPETVKCKVSDKSCRCLLFFCHNGNIMNQVVWLYFGVETLNVLEHPWKVKNHEESHLLINYTNNCIIYSNTPCDLKHLYDILNLQIYHIPHSKSPYESKSMRLIQGLCFSFGKILVNK